MRKILLIVCIGISFFSCKKEQHNLDGLSFKAQLQVLFPTAEITPVKVNDHFTEAYQLAIDQFVDHHHPKVGTFKQYIYVSHTGYDQPVVLVTEGYNARHRTYELSQLLKANQVMVEYRFYGKSRPDSIPWKYLTNDLAIEDYHTISNRLKRLYKKKWISTGISKGGETVLIYKSKYPLDVAVAVPYVAPLINTQEDPRTNELIQSVGTAECRAKIVKFQRAVLKNNVEILKKLKSYAEKKNMSFTKVSIEEALEYSVLEFPFSFWQWGGKCEEIPDENVTSQKLFDYLIRVSGVGLYNDRGVHHYLPSFYQHMTELGYYGFDLTPVKELLVAVTSSSNKRFAPTNVDLTYDAEYIKKVRDYVENKGDKILYIYGEYDPWGACAPNPKPHVDALKKVLKGGHHGTRIRHFPKKDQEEIKNKLQKWLSD
jgi:hypothetical protein